MKKLVLLTTVAMSLVGLPAFGQGYFALTFPNVTVWDGSPNAPFNYPSFQSNSVSVAWLWATSGDTPLVDALTSAGYVPSNTVAGTANGNYLVSTAWTDILTDTNFTLATANSVLLTTNVAIHGGQTWNTPSNVGIDNTSSGTTYALFMIAWENDGGLYLTPQQAELHSMYVGWSKTFSYGATAAPPLGSPPSLASSGLQGFGIGGVIPEPGTLALAGLGGFSLLFLRRRK